MSNDELQKAIDDITSSSDASAASADGAATVSLPDDFAKPAADNLGVSDVPENNLAAAAAPAEPAMKNGMDFEALPIEDKYAEKTSPEMDIPAVGAMPPADLNTNIKEAPNEAPIMDATVGADIVAETPKVEDENSLDTTLDNTLGANMNEAPNEAPIEKDVLPEVPEMKTTDPDLVEIETKALLELYPLLEKMNIAARQKFDICMKVIEKTGEKGATSAALAAAKDIADEKEKGECLIKLVEAIDKI